MYRFQHEIVAARLEFAQQFFYLAIQQFREIEKQFPEMESYVTELIGSIYEGEFQMPIGEVLEFLRDGDNDEDGYIENRLLGWGSKSEGEDET